MAPSPATLACRPCAMRSLYSARRSGMPMPARCPRRDEIEVAPHEGGALEVVDAGEIVRDAEHGARRQAAILVEHERRLEIVVERHDARPVDAEVGRRRLALQVDEDALDDRRLSRRSPEADGVGDRVLLGAARRRRRRAVRRSTRPVQMSA